MTTPIMACGCRASGKDERRAPACVIHAPAPDAYRVTETPDLAERTARCSCERTRASTTDLPFFEYRGENSPYARRKCRHCGYLDVAHSREIRERDRRRGLRPFVDRAGCPGFEPHGAFEFDSFYCGHAGWD